MTLMAALSGIAAAVGVLLIVTGLRPAPVTVKPPAPARTSRLTRWARTNPQAGVRALAAAAAGVILAATTGWIIAIVALPAAVIGLPILLSAPSARDRIDRLDAMQDWTRALAGSLSVGLGLEAAIKHSARSAPVAIRTEVQTLVRRVNSTARLNDALRAFADDLDDPTGDLLVANLIQANSLQGVPLSDVLTDISDSIGRDVAGRREVEADRAKPRAQVRIITIIFLLMLTALFLSSYAAPLRTPIGQVVLLIELTAFTGAIILQRKLAVIPESTRFLDTTHLPDGALR
jgi:tight adherence protein B